MKKLLLTFSSLVCIFFIAQAQYYYIPFINAGKNPGNLNNDAEQPSTTGWTTLQVNSATPVWSPVTSIPFTFSFNGAAVTQFKVSTSGVLTFTTGAATVPSSTSAALPNATIPNNSICTWGLAGIGANDYIKTKTFGTAPNRQFWIQFTSYSFTGIGASGFTYWAIVLEETSNNIYVVDERTYAGTSPTGSLKLAIGIQINSTTAYFVSGSPTLGSNATTLVDPTPIDNSYYQFLPGTQPARDLSVVSQNLNYYIQKNSSNTVSGALSNYGTATINSMALKYNINNGPAVTDNLSTLSIPMFGSYNYSHSTPWVPATAGNYNMKIWADNLNGNSDQNNLNDTLSVNFSVLDSLQTKMPLFEEFTQASCDPCANATPNLDSVLWNNRNICNVVRYHVNWPGTDYMNNVTQTPFVGNVVTYYAVTGVPDAKLDGSTDIYPGTFSSSDVSAAQIKGSPFRMGLAATYDAATQTYSVSVSMKAYGVVASGKVCRIALTVDTMTYAQNQSTETIPQYIFKEVAEDLLPSPAGTLLTAFASGQTQTVSSSWVKDHPWGSSPQTWTYDSTFVHITAWVQDDVTKYIYQSATVVPSAASAVVELTSNSMLSIYPNPCRDYSTISVTLNASQQVKVEVYNLVGEKIYSMETRKLNAGTSYTQFDASNLNNGIYFVKLYAGNEVRTQKIVVAK